MKCTLAEVERRLMTHYGWKGLHHELEFYGICPDCAEA
jgi:Fe2+ or Zn2+ uptake regulation protein